jgi:hypothetical protein
MEGSLPQLSHQARSVIAAESVEGRIIVRQVSAGRCLMVTMK